MFICICYSWKCHWNSAMHEMMKYMWLYTYERIIIKWVIDNSSTFILVQYYCYLLSYSTTVIYDWVDFYLLVCTNVKHGSTAAATKQSDNRTSTSRKADIDIRHRRGKHVLGCRSQGAWMRYKQLSLVATLALRLTRLTQLTRPSAARLELKGLTHLSIRFELR